MSVGPSSKSQTAALLPGATHLGVGEFASVNSTSPGAQRVVMPFAGSKYVLYIMYVCVRIYVYISVCVYLYTYLYIYDMILYLCVCVYVCMYIRR